VRRRAIARTAEIEAPVTLRPAREAEEPHAGGSVAAAPGVGASPSSTPLADRARQGGGDQHDPTKNASRRSYSAAVLSRLVEGRPCKDCGRNYSWYSLKSLVKRKASYWTMDEAIQAADLLCLNCRAEREQHQRDQGDDGVSIPA
jgi:hypothetical protein